MAVLVSSCLLGVACRYDGNHSLSEDMAEMARRVCVIPICPEQLGGLSTPRPPSIIVDGDGEGVLLGHARVLNDRGDDVTEAFLKGAWEALALANLTGAKKAFLKNRSPSCGLQTPYCETPTGYGIGVTAALLLRNDIEIVEVDGDRQPPIHR
ncbi:MAG: DUF523 domain-containing protein [Thermodesulfobacteriota bacterium]